MPTDRAPSGYTLLELVVVLLLAGVLAGLAAPQLRETVHAARRRGALDRVAAELYRARLLAVREGRRVEVRFLPAGPGCVRAYETAPAGGAPLVRVELGDPSPGVCLRVRGASTVPIDGRGLPRGAARTLVAELGAGTDSLRLSLVGRVHRFH